MKKLGPYEFEGTLGRGGMGTVFRGRHIDTGELHAVKVLSPVYSHDDHFRGRFESEINALLQLDHPNIVKLVSYGQEDGNLYFSMELIEGNSLFKMQKDGHRFNWREVLSIAKDVCQGLRHAHDRGIIHRDLKPGNLLMTQFKSVKITDFGIAKSFGTSQNTGDNILGTMDFMSPEQAKGEHVSFRSDLYSLGAVLYTLLSGRPPFTANSIEEPLRNLTRVPAPRIASKVSGIPDEIDEVIAKLMQKKPEKRVATALALFHRLEAIENSLKSYSEAKTAETGRPDDEQKTDVIGKSAPERDRTVNVDRDVATLAHFTDHSTSGKSGNEIDAGFLTRADKTVVEDGESDAGGKAGSDELDPVRNRVDFHNRVRDRDRSAATAPPKDPIEEQYGKGWLPILLMLLVVVSLATFGLTNAFQTPSADELFGKIQSRTPSAVVEECNTFVEAYPDDERIETVQQIFEFGKAAKYYQQLSNRLKAKENILGKTELSEIERQFLEIVDLSKSNFEAAIIRMDAFIKIHGSNPNLALRDRECVDVSKTFRRKIRDDAQRQAKTNINSIRFAMQNAAKADPVDAAAFYKSIIELYDSMSKATNPEVRDMVEEAKRLLDEMNSDRSSSSTPTDSSESSDKTYGNSSGNE